MEENHHRGVERANQPQDPDLEIPGLRNFQNNLQPRDVSEDGVSYQRLYLTNLILPVTILALSIFLVLFIFSIIYLWFRNHSTSWRLKKKEKYSTNSDVRFVATMAQYDIKNTMKTFKVLVDTKQNIDSVIATPKSIVKCNLEPCEDVSIPSDVKYIDERSDHRYFSIKPIVTTRNYGGSSPKFPEDDKKNDTEQSDEDRTKVGSSKFVFPTQSQEFHSPDDSEPGCSNSRSSDRLAEVDAKDVIESKCGRFKIAVPEQKWVIGNPNASFEYKKYGVNIPKPFQLVKAVKNELGDDLVEKRGKTFSLTRSPSLEKDDKSPFVNSAKSDRSEVFGFDEKVFDKNLSVSNMNNNVIAPISPKEVTNRKVLLKSVSVNSDNPYTTSKYISLNEKQSNLRKFGSVNTKLNMCSLSDSRNIDYQPEQSEMQSSPRILECSSAKEKYSGTRFNFSPKMLAGNQSPRFFPSEKQTSPKFFSPVPVDNQCSPTPKYFTPLENQSPKFFPPEKATSPKYFTPCEKHGSPKFFPERTLDRQSPAKFTGESLKKVNEYKETQSFYAPISPKVLLRSSSPKISDKRQLSPKVLANCSCRTPKSPKTSNKENYFKFERSVSVDAKKKQGETDEVIQGQRYQGRKSIEREYFDQSEHRKYRRYNSTDSCKKLSRELSFIKDSQTNNNLEDMRKDVVKNGLVLPNDFEENNVNSNGGIGNNNETPEALNMGDDVVDFIEPTETNMYEAVVEITKQSVSVLGEQKSCNVSTDSDVIEEKLDTAGSLDVPGSENYRRQRLKSISLDSDNAKIIEQNLGIPIAKHLKHENLSTVYLDREMQSACYDVEQMSDTRFTFDQAHISDKDESDTELVEDEGRDTRFSPDLNAGKRGLRDSSDTKSFIDMPRFSPKEFEVVITPDDSTNDEVSKPFGKFSKNLHNLTIDLNRRDSDLEQELLEFEKLYTDAEKRLTPKTPTLKMKAISLDSSETLNLSLPQEKNLQVPQNSISVPNTPKRQLGRFDRKQKGMLTLKTQGPNESGGKFGFNTLLNQDHRRRLNESGIFLRDNHANLMLYQPSCSRTKIISGSRMGSFDENICDSSENAPEINVSNVFDNRLSLPQKYAETASTHLGSNLLSFKQNLSVSSTNLKTLPEGVPSIDFEPAIDDIATKRNMLQRRGSNQSLPSSNCFLTSAGTSCYNLDSLKNSVSNFSLNDKRTNRVVSSDQQTRGQPGKKCLLQRRGSNNSLTLNIKNSNTNLSRYLSNSSLNIHQETKIGPSKGLLERRSSNTSLTLNINHSNPQLALKCGFSVSNYNLDCSSYNLSQYNSNQSINTNNTDQKKGLLERRASNTSLTLNINNSNTNLINTGNPDVPREIEIDDNLLDDEIKDLNAYARDKQRKSLSTENLLPKSYKNRVLKLKNFEDICSFGSHDDLWSSSLVTDAERMHQSQNLTYVGGDQENEMIYAFGDRTNIEASNFNSQGFVRNITTKPLSPQTTSEDFKMYIANIQHLQSASNLLTRSQLKYLNAVFQNGYSEMKCSEDHDSAMSCSGTTVDKVETDTDEDATIVPCCEYQKKLLRSLHQEFWDLPQNHQEKPMVFGSHIKNRYRTILPNEHSRVVLRGDCGKKLEGYINANFIKGHENSKTNYIATQGPLPNTLYDFWLMVFQNSSQSIQENAKTSVERDSPHENSEPTTPTYENGGKCVQKIVMLANFIEDNKQKCEKYFPLELNEEIVVENQNCNDDSDKFVHKSLPDVKSVSSFVILNDGVIQKTGYTIRKLVVRHQRKSDEAPNEEVTEINIANDKLDLYNTSVSDCNYRLLCNNKSVNVSSFKSEVGDDSVKLSDKAKNVSKVTVNIPKISQKESEKSLIVYHYWFHNWADHKCPKDVDALLNLSLDVLSGSEYSFKIDAAIDTELSNALCDRTSKKKPQSDTKFVFPPLESPMSVGRLDNDGQDKLKLNNVSPLSQTESPPIIVHCSAGIGRTGCLIAILNGIKQLHADEKVDILGIVCNMRLNRGGMVQNSEQYELIHKVLCLYEEVGLSPL